MLCRLTPRTSCCVHVETPAVVLHSYGNSGSQYSAVEYSNQDAYTASLSVAIFVGEGGTQSTCCAHMPPLRLLQYQQGNLSYQQVREDRSQQIAQQYGARQISDRLGRGIEQRRRRRLIPHEAAACGVFRVEPLNPYTTTTNECLLPELRTARFPQREWHFSQRPFTGSLPKY